MSRGWIVCVLLAALTLGAYWPVRNCEFIYYDDPQFITENPQITAGLTWSGLAYALTQPVVGNWHPVTVLSHMLDCELFGPSAGAHHLVNAALHTLNAVILFLLLRALTGATWRSAVVAAVFALHPLRVESVAWVSERKDVLSGLFFLLTVWAWAESRRPELERANGPRSHLLAPGRSRLSPRVWYSVALLFFALGLMSKPMLVTLPFVLLLLDLWPLKRLRTFAVAAVWPLVREKLPFLLLAGVCSAVTLLVQRGAGAMSFFQGLSFTDRLANAAESYIRYLGKMACPTGLAIVYPHPAHGYFLNDAWPVWQVIAAVLILLLVSVLCVLRVKRQPYFAVGWFWFLGTMLPVVGLVQVGEQAMANRYTYLPLIGPTICLVWGLWDVLFGGAAGMAADTSRTRCRRGLAAAIAAVLAVGVLIWLTQLQVRHWRNTVSLFEYAVAVTPDNPSAQFALGVGLEKEGRVKPAIVQYRVALAIDSHYAKANYNLGQVFSKAGDIPLAAAHFAAALRSSPGDLATCLNLANCLQQLGRSKEAAERYKESLRIDPGSTEGLNNLAWLLATVPDPQLRDGRRAVELAERAVFLSGGKLPVMIGTLAAAYAEAGRFPDAVAAAEKAVAAADLQGQAEVAARNRELLALYRAGRPYHETAR